MINFTVNDMTCGHCVASITQALNALDPQARVAIDLASHRVQVDSGRADAAALAAAIADAGYTPEPLPVEAIVAPTAANAGGCGSGCGCR